MRTIILSAVIFLSGAFSAEAQRYCARVGTGLVTINHRTGYLYGGNFYARVSCSRNAPSLVYWRGGSMCTGLYFYGRNLAGAPFSCLVRQLGYR